MPDAGRYGKHDTRLRTAYNACWDHPAALDFGRAPDSIASFLGHASPARESNPALRLRRPPCARHTRRDLYGVCPRQESNLVFNLRRVACDSVTLKGPDDQQGRKDLNPVREFWRLAALPGARPCHDAGRFFRPWPAPVLASGSETSSRSARWLTRRTVSNPAVPDAGAAAFPPVPECDRPCVRYIRCTRRRSWSNRCYHPAISARCDRS